MEKTTKLLSMRTTHHLLATIAIGMLLVRSEHFHLHDSIFLLKILTKNEEKGAKSKQDRGESDKPVCSFDQFKLILLSLFGTYIKQINCNQIYLVLV